uniref:Coiled-coil domain-containing protein 43 n=1 Tax=Erpetoichthys calabaricus TaxID=27687 RepID=A0A8C4TLT8_ERPCA
MAAPGDFDGWLVRRLDSLDVDGDVYAAYILGVLREEEEEDDDDDDGDTASALRDILSPFLEEDALEDVCKEIINQWALSSAHGTAKSDEKDAEVQAIASLIEKQAQIVVKQKEASEEEKLRKAALLAQYANVTDDEDEEEDPEESGAAAAPAAYDGSKSLFKNTNMEDVLNAKKLEREKARGESQKKKEQDKMQRDKDKVARQERKDKEKKRTQKGERRR